jgi:hypothetical protein
VIEQLRRRLEPDQTDADETAWGTHCTESEDGDDLPVADGDGVTPRRGLRTRSPPRS